MTPDFAKDTLTPALTVPDFTRALPQFYFYAEANPLWVPHSWDAWGVKDNLNSLASMVAVADAAAMPTPKPAKLGIFAMIKKAMLDKIGDLVVAESTAPATPTGWTITDPAWASVFKTLVEVDESVACLGGHSLWLYRFTVAGRTHVVGVAGSLDGVQLSSLSAQLLARPVISFIVREVP